ncbi:MAG: metallophosphoesterase [Oscillospiraceae bacterium]|nr:metallophosphoesterase [Oscillospiraceae bacterium]
MVYVTGDLHGDLQRFRTPPFRKLRRRDTLIVAGDFGFLWDGSAAERRTLERLGKKKYTILFIDGTHENHALLAAAPVTEFAGAPARQFGKRLYHISRGSVFTLEDHTFFVCGGGESEDRDAREEGVNWWPDELPSKQQLEKAGQALDKADRKVDFVITHEAPEMIYRFLKMDSNRHNYFSSFLDDLTRSVRFSRWLFGSLHIDKRVTPLFTAVFKDVIPLWDKKKGGRAPTGKP